MDIYSDQLRDIMSLIVSKVPQVEIEREIKKLKEQISNNIDEGHRIFNLLDGIANQYITRPNINIQQTVFIKPRILSSNDHKQQISEVANRLAKDGIINTQDMIPELRKLGNQKEGRHLLISIGNVLHQRGWKKVDVGKFRKPDIQKQMEVE